MRDKANDDNAAALSLLDALHMQHTSADDCHQRVDELGRKWLDQGELSPQDARSFNDLLELLSGTYREHIAIEERDVFTLAAEMFDDVELASIANEMAVRRGLTQKGNAVTRFNDLLALHRQLDELFLDHQRMLLRLDLDRAGMLLDDYEATLLAHIRDEEEFVIPLYQAKVTAPVGGAAEIFLGEHEKLRQFLVLFREELSKIRTMKDTERGVLFLIDSQHLFKRLLVHHDTREKKMLYPLLDEVTTEEERQELFARLELPPQSKIDSVLVKSK
jgi:hemerythrin-like domain-containing protein